MHTYPVKLTHIDDIKVGDVVEVDGIQRTVSPDKLKKGGFCGTTLWGDSYRAGTILVRQAVLPSIR